MSLSKLLNFEKLHNIRDIGGMSIKSGSLIKSGCFFRSGQLADISQNDSDKLKNMVDTIIDFRSDKERQEKQDVIPEGVSYIHLPIVDSLTAGVTRDKESDKNIIEKLAVKPEEAKKYMCLMYRGFTEESAVSHYAEFIRLLKDAEDKSFLWHCTAGKDRAGIGSAIIEEILGCSREDVIADYMSTNEYIAPDIQFLTRFVKNKIGIQDNIVDDALRYLFGAEEEYIEAFYAAVDEKYGDFDRFIHEGLKLSDADIELMKSKYTE